MNGLPAYKGKKRRCDQCDKDFRAGDLVAAVKLRFEAGSLHYTLVFCFDHDGKMVCLRGWRFEYEIEATYDFAVMEYHGKKKGSGGDTGRHLAPLK